MPGCPIVSDSRFAALDKVWTAEVLPSNGTLLFIVRNSCHSTGGM